MRKLLGAKLAVIKFVDSISGTLGETIAEAKNQAVDVSTNFVSININKVEHAGLSIFLKGKALSQENKNDYNAIKGLHKFEASLPDEAYFNFIFNVVNGSPAEVIEKLNKLIQHPMI
jgi:hypothetical protein